MTPSAKLTAPNRLWPWALAGAATLLGLAAVLQVHSSGQTALAATLLAVLAAALWTYTSRRTKALRYLFPGVAAALLFVVFPMLYTVGMGFTNHSSSNLLDLPRVRQQLLEETVQVPGSSQAFTLHAQGAQFRLRLTDSAGQVLTTGALTLAPGNVDGDAAKPHPDQHSGTPTAPPLLAMAPLTAQSTAPDADSPPLPLSAVVAHLPALRSLRLQTPAGASLQLVGLREMAQRQALYTAAPGAGSGPKDPSTAALTDKITDKLTGSVYQPNLAEGFFENAVGDRLQPGFKVGVGLRHYAKLFGDNRFREPFLTVLLWTVAFSALSVLGAAALGLLLAALLSWPALRGRGFYRLVLFLPYAVPGFLSILVFKGLFNQNLGEVNLVLGALFGVKPAWFSDPWLAKLMLLMVNVWLGFPYMMVLCSGLLQSIPADLREASSVAGAGPFTHFWRITLPLIAKPLVPLLIAAFAFNFNNFVLVSLLTGGRPDLVDATVPAGTTDILVTYTWRIAFQDSGQQYGLAAAISTVIFLLVAAITLLQLRFTARANKPESAPAGATT